MDISREDLQTLKADLIRELGGRLDRIELRMRDGDQRFEQHEVHLALLKRQTQDIESRLEGEMQPRLDAIDRATRRRVTSASDWPWKVLLGMVTLLTLIMQILVRVAEALIARL